jgi:hypothetical protein
MNKIFIILRKPNYIKYFLIINTSLLTSIHEVRRQHGKAAKRSLLVLGTGSHHVDHVVKFLCSSDPPASASFVAGTTSTCHKDN